MSQEHLVSECLFEGEVKVKGLPWCKDAEKTIGKGRLTAPLLCRHHNGILGEVVDKAAKHTLDTLRTAFDLWEVRKAIRARSWTKKYFETDMLLLERWCLKTLININLSNKPGFPIEPEGKSNRPTEELVRVVFGLDRFEPPKGLYRVAALGDRGNFLDGAIHLETQTLNDRLIGGKFELWGIPFVLSLFPEEIKWEGRNLIRGELKQWFNTRDLKNREVKSHLVTFTYPKE